MPEIILSELENAPKNAKAAVKDAEMIMKDMALQIPDACSGRWYDKEGRLMVAVFADHIKSVSSLIKATIYWLTSAGCVQDSPPYNGEYSCAGCSEKDVVAARLQNPDKVESFGLDVSS